MSDFTDIIRWVIYDLYIKDWLNTHSGKEFDRQAYASYEEFLDNEYFDREYIISLLEHDSDLIPSLWSLFYEEDLERMNSNE